MGQSTVPLMDCRRAYEELRSDHDGAIHRVMLSGRYLGGEEIQAFEASFAEACGVRHAVGVGNGTDALELALRAVGSKAGNEVIMAANAGMYACTATLLTGATPVFADVTPDTLLISPVSCSHLLTERTVAIVVTHLYGQLGDVAGIRRVAGNHSIRIIEDGAQAHGAVCSDGPAGSLGDLATFSFYPTKNLGAVGDAGAIVTHDADLADTVRQLAQYGWKRKYVSARPWGRNSRLDELQAAILNVRLPHLNRWNEQRRDIVRRYAEASADTRLSWVSRPFPDNACHLAVARHPERDRIREWFQHRGVSTAIHYPLLDTEQPALKQVAWKADELAQSSAAQEEIFTLPCFPQMTSAEIDHVCSILKSLD
jgi:dTDP-3-amino-2,3,6-trideoxy-4-keto-D-glucose/dTDP-3-amino-3,4,6-trideoxy-alpha-D-glucose/dTDP-2,6-dideoxy-D-kanosamine transaminase